MCSGIDRRMLPVIPRRNCQVHRYVLMCNSAYVVQPHSSDGIMIL